MKESESKPRQVGIWIRVSTDDQARGESPEHHELRARYYAESKGWLIREVYRLEAVSGKAVMEHPEAKRMLEDVRSGHIGALIFSKLARLARNTKELLTFAEIFAEHNADLVSLQESIDTASAAGRLFFTILSAMAEWERAEIAERVKASVPVRAKLGKPLGGVAPFGYQWVEKRLVPHPEEAPMRRLVYELFLEHQRKKTVARVLNERGYRPRSGKPFSDMTIEVMLRDPTAKGLRRANYSHLVNGRKTMKPESEWVYTKVKPIVSEALWDQCNHILDEQRAKRRPAARKAVHPFAGYVYCSCGKRMYVFTNSPKYVCKNCKKRIAVADLEDIFRAQLKTFLFGPEDLTRFLGASVAAIKEKEALVASLAAEQAKIRSEMEKLSKLYLADQLSVEGFGRENRPREERLTQLEEELPRLQAEIDFLKIEQLSSSEVLATARDVYAQWPSLTRDEKRRLVETITERIVVGDDEISLDLSYLPSLQEVSSKRPTNLTGGCGPG